MKYLIDIKNKKDSFKYKLSMSKATEKYEKKKNIE